MSRRRSYPIVPTIMTIVGVIFLSALSYWQFERLIWKNDLISQLNQRVDDAPVFFPFGSEFEIDRWQFRPVKLTGRFLHDQELHVLSRDLNGEEGLHIFTPFMRTDFPADRLILILINRGYVPFELKEQETRQAGLEDNIVTIEGILRFDKGIDSIRKMVLPEHEPENNLWYALDIEAMGAYLNMDLPLHYIMDGNDQVSGGFPKGKQWKLDIRNNHLEYALTWAFLAIGFAVIYIIYLRNWRNEE